MVEGGGGKKIKNQKKKKKEGKKKKKKKKTSSAQRATCISLQTLHLALHPSQKVEGCSCRWFSELLWGEINILTAWEPPLLSFVTGSLVFKDSLGWFLDACLEPGFSQKVLIWTGPSEECQNDSGNDFLVRWNDIIHASMHSKTLIAITRSSFLVKSSFSWIFLCIFCLMVKQLDQSAFMGAIDLLPTLKGHSLRLGHEQQEEVVKSWRALLSFHWHELW